MDIHDLKQHTLSQRETIGQSLASIAPTATPAMVLPVILTTTGNGSWLACVLALIAMGCVAYQINIFARQSSSAGSLYVFVQKSLGSTAGLFAGCALFFAYVGTACAVTGGLAIYLYALLGSCLAVTPAANVMITVCAVGIAGFLAYRNVQISTRVMLVIEAISICFILLLIFLPGTRSGLHWDAAQLTLTGASFKQIRSALVLLIFGFVGFESAASLGREAIHPLRTIPRAITFTVWLSGIFFIVCAYGQSIGFAGHLSDLAASDAPLQLLAELRHKPVFIPILSATTVCSFFACILACINAAARTAFNLSRDGHVHRRIGVAHFRTNTPHIAILASTLAAVLIAVGFFLAHVAAVDVYNWFGTFASYGFITVYFLVSVGAIIHLWRKHAFSALSVASLLGSFTILGMVVKSAFDPGVGIYRWLPHIYLALLLLVPIILLVMHRGKSISEVELPLG